MKRLILVGLVVLIATGCSSFRSKERINLAPFAENTISLAAEIEYGIGEASTFVNLRELWNDPALAAHRKEWDKVRALMKGVVAYSVEVTTLGNSTLSGPERAQSLAEFLDPLARPVLEYHRVAATALRITPTRMDSILTDIRKQKDLLAALRAAQPVIDEVARLSDQIFDQVDESLDDTARALITRIDQINANAVYYDKLVNQVQYSIFRRIVFLSNYRRTHEVAQLDSLYKEDPQLLEMVATPKSPTLEELANIESRLFDKVQAMDLFEKQIRPDIERYHLQQIELAEIYKRASTQLKRARTTMIVWSRAHRNLSQGITDPAKVNLFDITKKAIKTAL